MPAVSSSTDDQSAMQDWLDKQAEKLQDTVVNVQSGMSLTPQLYFGTRRSTYSDVISIVTTITPINSSRKRSMGSSSSAPLTENVYISPFQQPAVKNHDEHLKRNQALLNENFRFMSRLHSQRNARQMVEHIAACTVQRVYRGYSLRKNFKKLKQRLITKKMIRSKMTQVTKGTSLVLDEKARKREKSAKSNNAALVIQKSYRYVLATRAAVKEQSVREDEVKNINVTRIQRAVRGSLSRFVLRKRRIEHAIDTKTKFAVTTQRLWRGRGGRIRATRARFAQESIAAFVIQSAFRVRILSRKVLCKERHRALEEVRNHASLVIQRYYRGKIGRRRVFHIRNTEKEEISEACALLVQRVVRGRQGRRMAFEHKKRVVEESQLLSALLIQRIVRGFLGKCRFTAAAEDAREDIFIQTRLGHVDQVDDIYSGFVTDKTYSPTDVDKNGNTILLIACRWGHKKIVRKCLRWGMDINHENHAGHSALYLSIVNGHEENAEYLISKKAEISFFGRTMLHEAAKRGMTDLVRSLLTHGIKVDERDPKTESTPLHEAASSGVVETVTVILDHKGSIDAQNASGCSALHIAANVGSIEVVTLLLQRGADISVVDNKLRTAWRTALSSGHEACAVELRRRMVQLSGESTDEIQSNLSSEEVAEAFEAAKEGSLEKIQEFFDRGLDVDCIDADTGNTILIEGASYGHESIIRICNQWGASIEKENFKKQSALIAAAASSLSSEVKLSVCLLLIEFEADVLHSDDTGRCAIHYAALSGFTFSDIVSSNGISLDLSDTIDGLTPLHCAASLGDEKTCRTLMNLGASAAVTDKKQRFPLHLCCMVTDGSSSTGCAKLLVNAGNSVNEMDSHKKTPVHYAAAAGNVNLLEYLLTVSGGSVSATDDQGRPPVFDAVMSGQAAALELLLDNGASSEILDRNNTSLLHVVMESKSDDCLDILLEKDRKFDIFCARTTSGDTPLHVAGCAGYIYGAERLLSLGDSKQNDKLLATVNKVGDNPVVSSVRHGHHECLATFVAEGVNLQTEQHMALSLLQIAAMSDSPSSKLIESLVEAGLSVTQANDDGKMALHVAVSSDAAITGNVEAIKGLLKAGAPVNATTKQTFMTPLHCAVQAGALESCKILLENGANRQTTYPVSAGQDHTALQMARAIPASDEIIALLTEED